MTPTPHGQVPEALIDLIDAYAETRHRCGGIYNARTEAARNAVIEALSGVQALSAAPEAFLKSVIALCSHRGYSPANIEAWDKDDKWIADLWRQAESMLAASPTPPAEQQAAPKAAPTRTALPEGWTDCTIEFGNDGPEVVAYGPKRMMTRLAKWLGKYFAQVIAEAAPKAAPGEQEPVFAEVAHRTAIVEAIYRQVRVEFDYKLGSWATLDADEQQRIVDSIRGLYAAPQPAPATMAVNDDLRDWLVAISAAVADQDDRAAQAMLREILKTPQPSPTAQAAPQPAPAPLSEQDPLQGAANWLAQAHGQFCVSVLQGCLMIGHNRAKRLHDAALAAQGGKDA